MVIESTNERSEHNVDCCPSAAIASAQVAVDNCSSAEVVADSKESTTKGNCNRFVLPLSRTKRRALEELCRLIHIDTGEEVPLR